MKIRKATPSDAQVILSLIKKLAEYEKLSHEVSATRETIAQNLFSTDSPARCLLAEQEGKVVGFALYYYNFSTFLGRKGIYLEDLFVLSECRGRGYGKLLFAELARIAIAEDCGRLDWSVLDWNEPALRFYRSLGAKPLSEWTVWRLSGQELSTLASNG